MWDVNLLAAVRTIEATMPLVVYRLLVSLGIALAYCLSVLAGAGTGFALGSFADNPGTVASIGAFAGFALCGWLVYQSRPTLLHAVKASHLLALVEQTEGRALPPGKAQIDYAKAQLAARFPSVVELAQLDGGLRRCLRALPGLAWDLPSCLPVRHPQAVKAVEAVLGRVAASAGDALLASVLRRKDANPWQSAAAAVLSSASQWPQFYRNVAWMYGFMYAGWLASFLIIQIPVLNIASLLPMAVGVWPLVFALVLSWVLKAAFFEPIASAALMDYQFRQVEALPADPACQGRLATLEAYRDLQARAGA